MKKSCTKKYVMTLQEKNEIWKKPLKEAEKSTKLQKI